MTTTGTRDFDFIHGAWTVHNRKLRDATDPACEEWVEFPATSEAFPVLMGGGHLDRMTVVDAPDGPPFEGMTLRVFDPHEQVWRIWWSSTRAPGRLDPPLVGRFTDGRGVFEGDDVIGDRPVLLRFEWRADPVSPRWQQEFSYDGGATWFLNWVMVFTRPAAS